MVRKLAFIVPVILLAGCSDDASDTASPTEPTVTSTEVTPVPITTEPASAGSIEEAFSFADDDLCDWVPEAEVAEWVAAEFDWDATATEVQTIDSADGCEWTLASADGEDLVVAVSDASPWQDFGGNSYDFNARMAEAGVTEYLPPRGSVEIGAWVVGHPAVSDGVVVHNGGFGQFAFGVPPGPWLQVSLSNLSDEAWDEGLAYEQYEGHYFAVADRFLQALDWVS